MQEMWVRSLGQEDPLQKEMATHPRILAWETPWTEAPNGLQSMGSQVLDTSERLKNNIKAGEESREKCLRQREQHVQRLSGQGVHVRTRSHLTGAQSVRED